MSEDTKISGPDVKGFASHDHSSCKANGLRMAESYCEAKGLRLTPPRRRVLDLLLNSHHALGAYELLDQLRADGLGSQPPVVYRALDFLTQHGFVHKLERLNAFVACVHTDADGAHNPAFLICRTCRKVAEIHLNPDAKDPFAQTARAIGFQIDQVMVEAEGLCPSCQEAAA